MAEYSIESATASFLALDEAMRELADKAIADLVPPGLTLRTVTWRADGAGVTLDLEFDNGATAHAWGYAKLEAIQAMERALG